VPCATILPCKPTGVFHVSAGCADVAPIECGGEIRSLNVLADIRCRPAKFSHPGAFAGIASIVSVPNRIAISGDVCSGRLRIVIDVKMLAVTVGGIDSVTVSIRKERIHSRTVALLKHARKPAGAGVFAYVIWIIRWQIGRAENSTGN